MANAELLRCAFYFGVFIGISPACRIASFNTGLAPTVPYYEDRRQEIVPALEELNVDILCLQEVWFSRDVSRLVQNLKTTYPHSYSAAHYKADRLHQVSPIEAPCMAPKFFLQFLPCLSMRCSSSGGYHSYLACAERECALLDLEQHCISCLVMSESTSPIQSCLLDTGNRFNTAGLLLLSKYPILDANVTRFEPDVKLVLPRGYISAQVEGMGKVVCTHNTANLGPVYFEKLPYTNWQEQSESEARALLDLVQTDRQVVIMGDLNSSPDVQEHDVVEDMHGALTIFQEAGFLSAYVDEVGVCTWCKYNPLAHAKTNLLLDHILTKGMTAHSARRVLDEIRVRGRYPLSDHYGIQVTVGTENSFQ